MKIREAWLPGCFVYVTPWETMYVPDEIVEQATRANDHHGRSILDERTRGWKIVKKWLCDEVLHNAGLQRRKR